MRDALNISHFLNTYKGGINLADRNINGKIIQAFYTTEELSQKPLDAIIIDKGLVIYEKCDDGQIKMKIGDGINTWNSLKYINSINDEISSTDNTYSSDKIEDLLNQNTAKVTIKTWSSSDMI